MVPRRNLTRTRLEPTLRAVKSVRIITLDFDGVLHPFGCDTSKRFSRMHLIHRLLEQHSSLRLVVHSSWREIYKDCELVDFLFSERPELASRFLGSTPRDVMSRWESIEAWVTLNAHERTVCILDDEPRLFPSHVTKGQDSRFHFVECPSNQGLREHSPAWDKLRGWIYATIAAERSTP